MTVQPVRHRFTVHDYYLMAEAGIFHEDDRVELIEGEIFEMAPIGSRHAGYADFYTMRHPGPDESLLIIEVADLSLDYNSDVKMPLYGRAGVPEA